MGTNKNSSSRTRTLLNCRLSRSSSLSLFIPPLGVCKLAWTRSAWRMRRVATHNRNRGCHGGSRNTSFGGEGRTKGEKGRGEKGAGIRGRISSRLDQFTSRSRLNINGARHRASVTSEIVRRNGV